MHASRLRRRGTTDDPQPRLSQRELYEQRVRKTDSGCWGWSGPQHRDGYGRVDHAYAHRISYEIHVGPIPPGMSILHSCDNPPCTNPAHLRPGTHVDNMADALQRGRLDGRPNRPSGEANKSHKLTQGQVDEIRRLRAQGVPRRAVSQQFGIALNTISGITTGRMWRTSSAAS